MKHALPARARVVVVGGGVVGCSTAYHLAKRGWTDVVLLERKRLTSGTTWHAAGLITQARPTYGTREIVRRSLRVFRSLEEETGFATGFERTGTLHLADGAERLEELLRQASAARANGIAVEPVSPEQAVELFPPLYAGDLAGAVYYPDDGRGNATDTTFSGTLTGTDAVNSVFQDGFIKVGTGTLTLTGTNTFTGGYTVQAGPNSTSAKVPCRSPTTT